MSFEGWRKTAIKVERPGEEAEDPMALSSEEQALIDRVLAESPKVGVKEQVAVPKVQDELLHQARTDDEMIADAEKGINPHGIDHNYGGVK